MPIKCAPQDDLKLKKVHIAIDKFFDTDAIKALAKTNAKSPAVFFKDFYRNVTGLDYDYDSAVY